MHLPPSIKRAPSPFSLAATACGLLVAASSLTGLAESFVAETPLEYLCSGDFNGDGRQDVLLLDRAKGRLRLGYSLGGGIFDWVDWRDSGVKSVTGVSVGRLFDGNHDSVAVTSADNNLLSAVDAASSTKPADPVQITINTLGPNLVLAADIPGEGNTPLADLIVTSIYNTDDNPNKATLFRNTDGKFKQMAEFSLPVAGAHGNRLAFKPGSPELLVAVGTDDSGVKFMAGTVAADKLTPVLIISNLPAGADYVVGNFRGAATRDVVVFAPGNPEITLYPIEEANGSITAGAAKKVTLGDAVRQVVAVPGEKRARLLVLSSTNQAADLLEWDGGSAPVKLQQLWGATNRVLHGAMALSDNVLMFSTMTVTGKVVTHYQVYQMKDGKYAPGSYGALPTLDDRDDSTVPGIHARVVANLKEKTAADMKSYTNNIPGTEVPYSMIAIPGGEFMMGSPESESGRKPNEGPQHKVRISPFWMGQFEVTWEQYLLYMYPDDEKKLRETFGGDAEINAVSDAVTRPTKPYVDMSFGMGKAGFPAIAMTQHGANKFCHWLSAKTGHFYRLPTEAEWEYACRAGTTTAYSFGDDASKLKDYAWFFDNSNDKYQRVGKKLPNPWGLFDMHGNVREWTLDQFDENYYAALAGQGVVTDPWNKASKPYPHTSRGGSWYDDPSDLRSGARIPSTKQWKMTDPQLPKSRWWLSDATWIGIRLVRPLKVPPPEEMVKYWTSGVDKE